MPMKLAHTTEIQKEILKLNKKMAANESNAEAFNNYLANRSEKLSKKSLIYFRSGLSSTESFLKAASPFLLDESGNGLPKKVINSIKPLSEDVFEKNPYYQTIRFPNVKKGKWELRNSSYLSFEGFVSDELRIFPSKSYEEITPFGYFEKEVFYPEVLENDHNWMSVTPHEINTMEEAIENAKGKVLTFGLGMGYFAFMVSEKDEVTSLTIVEKENDAIALFKEFILPKFPHKEKIKIIKKDAFAFAKRQKDGEYDYCFADIWHLPIDGLYLYLQFKGIFKDFSKTKFDYWIEKSMLSLLRRAMIILISEEYEGSTDDDYDFAATPSDELINALHFKLKNKSIKSGEDLLTLLSDESLKEIAATIYD